MRFRTMRSTLLSLVLLCVPALVYGQQASDEDRERARAHSDQARIHYNLGQFDDALDEYSAAYELFPHPAFLFNIGQCHRELDNCDRAIFFFEGYLREMPEAGNRDLVEEFISECETRLEQDPGEDAGVEDGFGDSGVSVETDAGPTEIADADTQTDADIGTTERPVYKRWWFWTIIGVVVAGAVAGGTVVGVNANDSPEPLPSGSLGTIDWR